MCHVDDDTNPFEWCKVQRYIVRWHCTVKVQKNRSGRKWANIWSGLSIQATAMHWHLPFNTGSLNNSRIFFCFSNFFACLDTQQCAVRQLGKCSALNLYEQSRENAEENWTATKCVGRSKKKWKSVCWCGYRPRTQTHTRTFWIKYIHDNCIKQMLFGDQQVGKKRFSFSHEVIVYAKNICIEWISILKHKTPHHSTKTLLRETCLKRQHSHGTDDERAIFERVWRYWATCIQCFKNCQL